MWQPQPIYFNGFLCNPPCLPFYSQGILGMGRIGDHSIRDPRPLRRCDCQKIRQGYSLRRFFRLRLRPIFGSLPPSGPPHPLSKTGKPWPGHPDFFCEHWHCPHPLYPSEGRSSKCSLQHRTHGEGGTDHSAFCGSPIPMDGTDSLDLSHPHPFYCVSSNLLCLEKTTSFLISPTPL